MSKYDPKYYQKHKKDYYLWNKKYRNSHKDLLNARRREIYKKNPDAIKRNVRKWLDNNRERWNAYQREYYRLHYSPRKKRNYENTIRHNKEKGI